MSTSAYVDLMFGWGHARLGDAQKARNLVSTAAVQLTPVRDRNHDWLLRAFSYRVEQAIQGARHDGSWPPDLIAALADAQGAFPTGASMLRFAADRLRASSRILEPVDRVDPYAPGKKDNAGPTWFWRTSKTGPPDEWLQATFDDLVQLADHASPGAGVGSLVHPHGTGRFIAALEAAQRGGQTELVAARLRDLRSLVAGTVPSAGRTLYLLLTLSKALIQLQMRSEAVTVADEHHAAELTAYRKSMDPERLVVCLALAALDLWLGRGQHATPVLELACEHIPQVESPVFRTRVASDYLEAIARGRWPEVLEYIWSMMSVLPRVPNNLMTSTHFSRLHLEIADRVVLAITTPNFGPPSELRRSMPDAEFAGRREALSEVRARLVEWGQKDWDGPAPKST